ncbi:flagellin N-terminal helical domain-containing protein [Tepidimonas charontis]|uniref:Flagellin n=1 Tax=Tepidimonas charontis TaxID=2267262 RepID=A0A554XK59_9BURK|nr:flagellin [Tepidimonas charontis]TSE36213.1 B-type flagellin [Tepidimonas charontis]
MPQTINTNLMSLTAQRNLSASQSGMSTTIARLSSGLRINSARDDAAGLAIAERMTTQVRGLNQAVRNANDGISLSQTIEGALGSSAAILQRIRELAVQAANGSNSGADRQALNAEAGQLVAELQRIADTTEFNGLKVLNGAFGSQTFQVGANAYQTITVGGADVRTNKYGLNTAVSAAATPGASAGYNAGTLTINGLTSKTVAIAANDTAKVVADRINAVSAETGVTAQARSLATLDFAATGAFTLSITSSNSAAVTISFNVSNANSSEGLSQAVAEINKVASQTGVSARLNEAGNAILLENSRGDNITITNSAGGPGDVTLAQGRIDNSGNYTASAVANITTGNNATSLGYVSLDAASGFSVSQSGTNVFAAANTTSDGSNTVNTINLSTFDKASMAIRIVDQALQTISATRASYGALMSRFESTITNLQTTSENIAAARSRIQDADFAAETAALSRAQILQQAGTAMVAQANQLPQNVLRLLQG